MADPQTLEKVRNVVKDTLVAEFELQADQIVPTARLREDLGLDSLDGVDLIVALEKAMGVQIPETDARQMRTVGDIYAFIEKSAAQLAGQPAAPAKPEGSTQA